MMIHNRREAKDFEIASSTEKCLFNIVNVIFTQRGFLLSDKDKESRKLKSQNILRKGGGWFLELQKRTASQSGMTLSAAIVHPELVPTPWDKEFIAAHQRRRESKSGVITGWNSKKHQPLNYRLLYIFNDKCYCFASHLSSTPSCYHCSASASAVCLYCWPTSVISSSSLTAVKSNQTSKTQMVVVGEKGEECIKITWHEGGGGSSVSVLLMEIHSMRRSRRCACTVSDKVYNKHRPKKRVGEREREGRQFCQ